MGLHPGDYASFSNDDFFVAVKQVKRTAVQCLQFGDIDSEMSVIVFVDQDQEIIGLVAFQRASNTNSTCVKKIVDDCHFNGLIRTHQKRFQFA